MTHSRGYALPGELHRCSCGHVEGTRAEMLAHIANPASEVLQVEAPVCSGCGAELWGTGSTCTRCVAHLHRKAAKVWTPSATPSVPARRAAELLAGRRATGRERLALLVVADQPAAGMSHVA